VRSQLIALLSYIFATTFTPGPNNVSSTAAGTRLGYRRSLPYLAGIACGFAAVMLLCGLFDAFLKSQVEGFLAVAKWVGFAYMLWLIVGLFLPHGKGKAAEETYTFVSGLFLQVMNVKVILYGLTIYGMFAAILASSWAAVAAWALGLACVSFVSISTWCLVGSALSRFLADKRAMLAFNIVLALMLAYCAYAIVAE
jgi:cysteine/O-acetylserine efflux protein